MDTNELSSKKHDGVSDYIRVIVGLVVGIYLANRFGEDVAGFITHPEGKFLFLNSFTANLIAVRILICIATIKFFGDVHNRVISWPMGLLSAAAVTVLYAQFSRTIMTVKHYLLLSVGLLLASLVVAFFGYLLVMAIRNSWTMPGYIVQILVCFAAYCAVFWKCAVDIIVLKFFHMGFFSTFDIVFATGVIFVISAIVMIIDVDDLI